MDRIEKIDTRPTDAVQSLDLLAAKVDLLIEQVNEVVALLSAPVKDGNKVLETTNAWQVFMDKVNKRG